MSQAQHPHVQMDTRPTFDPFSRSFMRNPYPAYQRLLESETLTRSSFGFWVASRFEHVNFVLKDRRFGHTYAEGMLERHGPEIFEQASPRAVRQWILVMNPPDHTRVRGLLAAAFSPRALKEKLPQIEQVVDKIIDAFIHRGQADLIKDFAYPLPALVICEMLGIPEEDRAQFLEDSRVPTRLIDLAPLSPQERRKANTDVEHLTAYFERLCELRRQEPRNDLTTLLVQAEDAEGRLTSEELTANMILLFGAGQETTAHMLGNSLLALHQNPDQLELLKANPELAPNAVEELLRYDSSVQVALRHALEEVEVGGIRLSKGERVMALLGAANRDGAVYEDPDRLDITRQGIKPMSFGGGIHYCLGAQLARFEMTIGLQRLFQRIPGLRLEGLDQLEYRRTLTVRGLEQLRASW
jgi:cytochrome P450